MSNIDKRALRESAEKAQAARARLESIPDEDVVLFEDDDIKSDVCTCNKFIVTANPATVLALLDEMEAKDKQIAEFEFAQSLYDEGASMLCGQFDDLAAAMGWTSDLAEKQGVSQLEYARGLKRRIAALEAREVKLTDINCFLADVDETTLANALRLLAEGVRAADISAIRRAGISVTAAGKGDAS